MRRQWKAALAALALAALCATACLGCLSAEPVEASRDDCLRAIARQYTAYMADHDCRSILGGDYCAALLVGVDVRAGRGDSAEKIERVYYAHCP